MADNSTTITLVGRIGQEPQLRTTSRGEVLNFTVATNERKRNADNTWVDGPTSWFEVAAWGGLARNAQLSFHRGQRVIVQGVLRITDSQTESGTRIKRAELRATALGHELTWGTSTFVDAGTQSSAPQPPAEEHRPALEPVPAGAPASDWGSSLGAGAASEIETPF